MVLFSNFHSCLSTGQIFRMFVHMTRARKILLIGKLKGYSILAIAEELPDDGKIFACAEAPYLGVNSQEAFDYSSDGKKISMREGPVADTLEVKSSGRGVWDLLCRAHQRISDRPYFLPTRCWMVALVCLEMCEHTLTLRLFLISNVCWGSSVTQDSFSPF